VVNLCPNAKHDSGFDCVTKDSNGHAGKVPLASPIRFKQGYLGDFACGRCESAQPIRGILDHFHLLPSDPQQQPTTQRRRRDKDDGGDHHVCYYGPPPPPVRERSPVPAPAPVPIRRRRRQQQHAPVSERRLCGVPSTVPDPDASSTATAVFSCPLEQQQQSSSRKRRIPRRWQL
jgi:hypothetical protein